MSSPMAIKLGSFLFLLSLLSFFSFPCAAQTCAGYSFPNGERFATCSDLPALNCYLHWNYHKSSRTVDIAFRRPNTIKSRWISWAINPTSKGMVGSQALVAFQKPDGTLAAYTSPITSYRTNLQKGDLSFPVSYVSAAFQANEMIIYATLALPGNATVVNHVWEEGPVMGGAPGIHQLSGPNVQSVGTLDFQSGTSASPGGISSRTKAKTIHGILCALGWGILMPLGVLLKSHMETSGGFYVHVACQCLATLLGLAGAGIGFGLGIMSKGITYTWHMNIGIALVCGGFTQVLVGVLLRPKKEHKLRLTWSLFHFSLGYGIIIMTIVNIFEGFKILHVEKTWKITYMGIVVMFACLFLIFEFVSFKKKKSGNNSA